MTEPAETWTQAEIDARRDDAPARQQPTPDGVADVPQDPQLFPLDDATTTTSQDGR